MTLLEEAPLCADEVRERELSRGAEGAGAFLLTVAYAGPVEPTNGLLGIAPPVARVRERDREVDRLRDRVLEWEEPRMCAMVGCRGREVDRERDLELCLALGPDSLVKVELSVLRGGIPLDPGEGPGGAGGASLGRTGKLNLTERDP